MAYRQSSDCPAELPWGPMSRSYKFHDPEGTYFITFATVEWVDVFTRRPYRDIVVDSLRHCQEKKGLLLYAWVIMSNHVHLIASASAGHFLPDILRDLKKFTASQVLKAIADNGHESRKTWMLEIFARAGAANPNNTTCQFWQQDNHPVQLVSAAVLMQKLDYLHNNPVMAGYVEQAEEYVYSSAPAMAGRLGLLTLEPY